MPPFDLATLSMALTRAGATVAKKTKSLTSCASMKGTAGTDGIAVVSAIQRARDPEAMAEQFKRIISSVLESRAPTTPR